MGAGPRLLFLPVFAMRGSQFLRSPRRHHERAHDIRACRTWPAPCTARGMLAAMHSSTLLGIEAEVVRVEADVAYGLPGFTLVGLPDVSVRESRDRVRSAIRSSGLEFPPHRITVNLAPADLRKAGTSFDLPIALAILAAARNGPPAAASRTLILGELSLDGQVLPARGVLPAALGARRHGLRHVLVPSAN